MVILNKSLNRQKMTALIVILYLLLSSLWICLGDSWLLQLTEELSQFNQLHTLKNAVFILLNSGILYLLMHQYCKKTHSQTAALGEIHTDLQTLSTAMAEMGDRAIIFDQQGCYLKVLAANPSVATDDLIGKTLHEVFEPAQAEFFTQQIQRVLTSQEPLECEYSLPTTINHQPVWFTVKISPRSADSVLWVARDITEQKQAKAALRESQQQCQLLFESNPYPIFVYDSASLRFLAVNDAAIEHYGYPRDEFLRMTLLDICPEEECPTVLSTLAQINSGHKKGSGNWSHYQKDGTLIEVEVSLHCLTFAGKSAQLALINDVTAQKRTEETLQHQNRQYRLLARNFPNGIVLWFNENLRYTLVEGTGLRRLGLSRKMLEGKTSRDILPEDACNLVEPLYRQALGGKAMTAEITYASRIYLLHVLPIDDPQGTITSGMVITQDITERKQMEEALQESQMRYRLLFEYNPQPLWIIELESDRFLAVNEAAIEHYGYSREEFLQMTLWDIRCQEDYNTILNYKNQFCAGVKRAGTWKHLKKDGTLIEVEVSWYHSIFAGRQAILVTAKDATEQKQAERQLRRYAFYDQLTNLPNRTLFLQQLAQQLELGKRDNNSLFAVLLLAIECFETVKYSLGHEFADQLVMIFAQRLQKCLPAEAVIARLGTDEFGILLRDLPNKEAATTIANSIHQYLTLPFKLDGHEVFSKISIGIVVRANQSVQVLPSQMSSANSLLPSLYSPLKESERPEDLLRAADMARHHAKVQTHLRHAVYEPKMHEQAMARFGLETDLRRALERQQFQVYYQPIMSLKTGKVSGFEALGRWLHPSLGMISPIEFIPLAEETGIISLIDWWVIRQACTQLASWQQQFPSQVPLTMSVNLSGLQLTQRGLWERLNEILRETGINGRYLKLEITESGLLKNTTCCTGMLWQMKSLGVQLSIDDFGTGYSSLARLNELPIDTLKIDRSFVEGMSFETNSLEIVRAIISLAHSLEMEVIAEGIETPDNLAKLRSLGCEYGQGYLFSKPLDSKTAEEFLEVNYRF